MGKGSAPTPGVGKRRDAVKKAQTQRTIEIRGVASKPTAFLNLPLRELGEIAEQSGRTFEWWMDNMSLGSIRVLWWVARRVHGEPTLSLDVADAEFREQFPDLMAGEVEIFEVDGDDSDPQL